MCSTIDDFQSVAECADPYILADDAQTVYVAEIVALCYVCKLPCSRVEGVEATVFCAYPYCASAVFHHLTHVSSADAVAHVVAWEKRFYDVLALWHVVDSAEIRAYPYASVAVAVYTL